MRRARAGRVAVLVAMALAVSSPRAAGASTADECVDANTKGQLLRRSGKFSDARDQFERCSDPKCPTLVGSDCLNRRAELEQLQPTIIFEVEDARGQDIAGVTVIVDDKPVAKVIDGTELRVDPGEHVFTFRAANAAPLARTLVIAEGVKGRHERVSLSTPLAASAANGPPPAGVSVADVDRPAPRTGLATPTVFGIVVAGAGLAGVATGAIFGGVASDAWNQQKKDCTSPTTCPNHAAALADHDRVVFDGTASNVAFISGGALLALATVLFLLPRHESKASRIHVVPSVGRAGVGLGVGGTF